MSLPTDPRKRKVLLITVGTMVLLLPLFGLFALGSSSSSTSTSQTTSSTGSNGQHPDLHSNVPRIIFSNDDGLGSLNLYQFYTTLNSSGRFDILVSAPCDDKSGTASRDTPDPEGDVRTASQGECRFNSTHHAPGKRNGHGIGIDRDGLLEENPRIYWVNGYPVTSMRLGIDKFWPETYPSSQPEHEPDLALSGINFGLNGDNTVSISGTVGAARFAAAERGIPAIAFSGGFGRHVGWNADSDSDPDALVVSDTYAGLATSLVLQLIKAAPATATTGENNTAVAYLPRGILMNINFPDASPSTTECGGGGGGDLAKFRWVLTYTKLNGTTIAPEIRRGNGTGHGYECDRVPTEGEVLTEQNQKRCLVSLSLLNATDLGVASVTDYEKVLERLNGWGRWTCL